VKGITRQNAIGFRINTLVTRRPLPDEAQQRMPKNTTDKLTQTEKAYAAIKKAILQGDIQEGAFLSESEIMAKYRIGRTPFREACNRLHHEGLLQAVPRRGYLVPELSFQTVRDLFEVRLILEAAIGELAALRATDGEIQDLRALAEEAPTKSAREKNEITYFIVDANIRFHLQLAKTARNRNLLELLTRNLEAAERLMYIELRSSRFRDRELQAVHGRIVDALETRDPRLVRDAVLDDIIQAQQVILAFGTAMRRDVPLDQERVITSLPSVRDSTNETVSSGDVQRLPSNRPRPRSKASA
jgi:DNA-binding GntR family transcriptional regulator